MRWLTNILDCYSNITGYGNFIRIRRRKCGGIEHNNWHSYLKHRLWIKRNEMKCTNEQICMSMRGITWLMTDVEYANGIVTGCWKNVIVTTRLEINATYLLSLWHRNQWFFCHLWAEYKKIITRLYKSDVLFFIVT